METRRSFVSRMNPCGLSAAEKGCYIFAMFNMVFISTCLLASMYYVNWAWHHLSPGYWGIGSGMDVLFSLILAFLATISFAFAVVLCFGVDKKRPSYIKAYFIYGIIEKIIVIFITLPVMPLISFDEVRRNWFIAALVINVIYSLPLVVVYRAHRALSAEATDTYKLMDVPLA